MKVEKTTAQPAFKPVVLTVTVETQDEYDFLKELGGSNFTNAESIWNSNPLVRALSKKDISRILVKFYDALK